jgi:aryl-alcohol dehydrogenase-like predicted oxidoreductase
MIEPDHPQLSIGQQCKLLSISRSSFYYTPKGETDQNLSLMRQIDEQFLETPFFGVRQMTWHLRNERHLVNEKRIRRLMRLMGLMPIYQKPNTSKPGRGHKTYPYLLRGLRVDRPNQVWCSDITYLPMRRGFLYLVAIMDWHTCKVLACLGLGCMGMSEFYGPADDNLSMRVLYEAVDLGINFLDSADIYGPHHNEELIGRFLKQSRASVKVATKFGIKRAAGEYRRSLDNSPDYARKACEGSLRRLGVDRIDLFYVHRVQQDRPIEEVMEGLAQLVSEGKIAGIGLCEVGAATLRRAHGVHPVAAVQTEYSLWSRGPELEVLPTCRELGIGFVPYAPLGRGFLTGRFQSGDFAAGDFRSSLPRFQADAVKVNRAMSELVAALAQRLGCTPAQLAIAWLLAKGKDIVPIPGTRRVEYLHENAGAASVRIDAKDMGEIDTLCAQLPVVGERYTEEGMKGVDA